MLNFPVWWEEEEGGVCTASRACRISDFSQSVCVCVCLSLQGCSCGTLQKSILTVLPTIESLKSNPGLLQSDCIFLVVTFILWA